MRSYARPMERTARLVAPAAIALFAVAGIVNGAQGWTLGLAAAGFATVVAAAMSASRAAGWSLVAGLSPVAVSSLVIGHGEAGSFVWMNLCVLAAWVALTSAPIVAVAATAGLVALPLSQWVTEVDEPGWAAWSVGTTFAAVSCVFAATLRRTVEELRGAQAELAERTRAEERGRIAAEVHDVIGHALTVSLLHIGSARLALDEEPAEARRSLEEAERLARASLEEVRATVGLMRADGPDATGAVAPLPGGGDVLELVESFRRAGTEVDLVVSGDLDAVGSTRGLAAYRIVQEALTNAVRHAPGAPVAVRLVVGADEVDVTVTNPAAAMVPADPGTGLRGMTERAESLGGRLTAGPSERGWRVEAVLPR